MRAHAYTHTHTHLHTHTHTHLHTHTHTLTHTHTIMHEERKQVGFVHNNNIMSCAHEKNRNQLLKWNIHVHVAEWVAPTCQQCIAFSYYNFSTCTTILSSVLNLDEVTNLVNSSLGGGEPLALAKNDVSLQQLGYHRLYMYV